MGTGMSSQISRIAFKELYTPFIGGGYVSRSTTGAQIIPLTNPATGDKITDVISSSSEEVRQAVDYAQVAFESGVWSNASIQQRSTVLSRLAVSLKSRVPELAVLESLQTDFQAPFNHPLLIAIKKIAPALAMGNSVIVKPSELAPISVLEFAQMALDAGVPSGVLQVLTGAGPTTGVELISDPRIRKVDITAGTKTGREIGRIVGENLGNYTAELGGKAPILVFEDACIKAAVNGVAFAAFIASGQTCVSGTRLLVHSKVYDEFMAQFLEKTRNITNRIGNPLNYASSMGPVVSSRALSRIISMVSNRTSGTIVMGGERMSGKSPLDGFDLSQGYFYPPTVIENIDIRDEVWQEEIFGPVIVVKRFNHEQEGVNLANANKYGLGAGIWTQDLSRAHRVSALIDSGIVWVNCHHRNDPSSPWGGMKESGIGRENGIEAFECYSQSKSVIINYASPEEIQEKEDWFADDGEERRYG
ncbi:hypothetical protein Clacol_001725 [Clathrus columnatus]|uniref:Aldehyde dehydrogenase domain-containing protein n=1 Tax=Clathrus columnatus TaxID=1419009 RepID=A0AAV5A2T4_9AGAM|nr:hypothetical protein Clacol_001725 [Clathrus columnatus]